MPAREAATEIGVKTLPMPTAFQRSPMPDRTAARREQRTLIRVMGCGRRHAQSGGEVARKPIERPCAGEVGARLVIAATVIAIEAMFSVIDMDLD